MYNIVKNIDSLYLSDNNSNLINFKLSRHYADSISI